MKKILTILLSISILIIALISIYYIYVTYVQKNNQQFTFKKSAPGNYDQGVNVDTEISFEFSNTLSRKEGVNTIEASPSTILTKEIRDNTVIFKPNKHLKENTQYTFKLSNISSIDNNTANPIILIFNTGKDNTVQAQFNKTLPYQGDGFYIDFDSTENVYKVTIQKSPYDKYKQNAINFLTDKGINTNTEKIIYEQLRFLQGQGAPPG